MAPDHACRYPGSLIDGSTQPRSNIRTSMTALRGRSLTLTALVGPVLRPRSQARLNTGLELTCRLVFGRMFLCEGLGIGHEQHDDPREEKERAAHSKGHLEAVHLGKATKRERSKVRSLVRPPSFDFPPNPTETFIDRVQSAVWPLAQSLDVGRAR